jgi:hypothetical protein
MRFCRIARPMLLIINDFERIGNAAAPEGIPDCVNLVADFSAFSDNVPGNFLKGFQGEQRLRWNNHLAR